MVVRSAETLAAEYGWPTAVLRPCGAYCDGGKVSAPSTFSEATISRGPSVTLNVTSRLPPEFLTMGTTCAWLNPSEAYTALRFFTLERTSWSLNFPEDRRCFSLMASCG